jgi:hypothetical protein
MHFNKTYLKTGNLSKDMSHADFVNVQEKKKEINRERHGKDR